MQPDNITLDSGGASELVMSRYAEYDNRTQYISPLHTVAAKDMMTLYRTEPKAVANYFGTAKAAVKFTKDFTVALPTGGDGKAPLIVELNFSIPVGISKEDAMAMAARVTHILAAGTTIEDLISKLEI